MTDLRTTHLSPAAYAVVHAAHQADYASRPGIAAALRAAADRARSQTIIRSDWVEQDWILKADLLAIAAELDPQP
jgi:hypothetical protein